MITMLNRRSRLRVPALLGGVLLLFGGAVDAWGASACVYHGHDAHDFEAAEGTVATAHSQHEAHLHHAGGHETQGHEHEQGNAHDAPVAIAGPSPDDDDPEHAEHCECRLRCIAVGALPPLEPDIIEVPVATPPQEDALSPVDLSTGVHAPATVPYLLPFSLAPPTRT